MCGVAFVEEREESNKPVILLICYVGVRFGLKYKKKELFYGQNHNPTSTQPDPSLGLTQE